MKKIISVIAFAICLAMPNLSLGSGQKVDIVDISNNELVFIINRGDNSSFGEYCVFQYEATSFNFLSQKSTFSLVGYTSSSITIQCDNEQVTFSTGFGNNTANHFYGYGFSKRNGVYNLNMPLPELGDIFDVVIRPAAISGDGGPKHKITCHSGGVGSTSCSAEAGTLGGGGSCSTTCSSGHYACCDDTKNECKCIKNPTSSSSGSSTTTLEEAVLNVSTIRAYYSN